MLRFEVESAVHFPASFKGFQLSFCGIFNRKRPREVRFFSHKILKLGRQLRSFENDTIFLKRIYKKMIYMIIWIDVYMVDCVWRWTTRGFANSDYWQRFRFSSSCFGSSGFKSLIVCYRIIVYEVVRILKLQHLPIWSVIFYFFNTHVVWSFFPILSFSRENPGINPAERVGGSNPLVKCTSNGINNSLMN